MSPEQLSGTLERLPFAGAIMDRLVCVEIDGVRCWERFNEDGLDGGTTKHDPIMLKQVVDALSEAIEQASAELSLASA